MIKDRVGYELGVMMFNAYNLEYGDLIHSNYDITANFEILVQNLGETVNKEDFYMGYVAEGQNYGLIKEKLHEMFKRDLAVLKEY